MKRNILFVQAESLDGRALGCMGEPGAHTPNLDRLAERGAVFDQAYCNSPQCCPSRSSMWSGRHVWQVGAWNNYRGLPGTERTFVQDLERADYQCPVVGRTDHRSGSHSVRARMSAWVRSAPDPLFCNRGPKHSLNDQGHRQRPSDWEWLDQARAWLTETRDTDRPFFLHLGLINTHPGAGYKTSRYWLEKIDPERVSMPPEVAETHPVMRRMLVTKGCDREFDRDFVHTCRRHYLAMIAEVDGIIGELLDTLEECGLTDDTVVIFTADHGDMRLEHGQYLKNALYEGSARVPLIMAGPGVQSGRRVPRPVSLVDIYPTLLDVAETEGREDLAGHSLMPLAAGTDAGHPGVVFSEYHSNFQQTGSFMLRKGPWKYLTHAGYRPQLFNLDDDPDELDDRAEEVPDLASQLDAELNQIADCRAIDAAAKATDAAEFATWRLSFPGDGHLEQMRKLATRWDDEIAVRFAAWADAQAPSR